MKILASVMFLLIAVVYVQPQTAAGNLKDSTTTKEELIKLNQELIDALARGDKSVADRIYSDNFIRISVKGELFTKAQLLASLKAPEPGVKISYESIDIQVIEYANTAVLTYLSIRHTNNNSEKSDFRYRVADTFVKVGDQWKKAVSSGTPIPDQSSSPN